MIYYERSQASSLKVERQRQIEEGEKEKERTSSSGRSSSRSAQGLSKQAIQQQKQNQAKRDKEMRAKEKQRQNIRKAAWVAVRTAGAVAKAQKRFEYLATDSVEVSEESKEFSPPDFALHEILKTDSVLKDDESGCVVNSGVVRLNNRFGKTEFYRFSWLHIVNFARALMKQTSYAGMGLGSSKLNVRRAFGGEKHALKMRVIHQFLKESLTIYEKECCPILPVDFFLGLNFASMQTSSTISIHMDGEEPDGKYVDKAADVIVDAVPNIQKEADGTGCKYNFDYPLYQRFTWFSVFSFPIYLFEFFCLDSVFPSYHKHQPVFVKMASSVISTLSSFF